MLRRCLLFVSAACLAAIELPGQVAGGPSYCLVTPEVTDNYTALLDHFNGTTTGQVTGQVSYGPGINGLSSALQFSSGSSVEYSLSGWYQWTSDYDAAIGSGAIELWIKPAYPRVAGDFLIINWYNSSTPLSSGYITELGQDANGRLTFGGWTSITNNPFNAPLSQPHTKLPLSGFTHIAYTWSPTGTALYVNGDLEAVSLLNYYPALNPTVYVYLNPWGSNVAAAVDELRISTLARADLMKCAN